ncbi:MAG: M4 family metallopeptidase [Actinomycetota bacterium]
MRALRIFAFIASFGLLAGMPAAGAGEPPGSQQVPPGAQVASHRETGEVRFMGSAPGRPIARPTSVGASAPSTAIARAFLQRYGRAFGIRDQAKELRVMSTRPAPSGRSVVRFQQVHEGVPVLGGELVVNLDADGDVLSASGEALPGPGISVEPGVTASEARRAAIAAVAGKRGTGAGLEATTPRLWIYDSRILGGPGLDVPTLVWRMDVRGEGPIDELVLVDGRLGNVVVRIDHIHEARDRRVCDAANTSSQYPCTSPVRTELDPPHAVTDVNNAFDFSGDTYDFFFDNFGRDSLDDAGMILYSTVRFCPSPAPADCPYQNAFWDGAQMVYGAGFAVDDVVGHELTHGVTEFTSHLFYYYQSGAINESLSDVFGEFVDLTNGAGTDTASTRWLLGEDIPGIGAIRDMEDPPAFGHPDRMTSPNYTADPDEIDGGGVHTNSGVNNKATFLITDGGTFNGQTVTGLGIDKAAQIYYEVATNYLTSASDYADLATGLVQSCTNLIGTAGITAANCDEVFQAVLAVEMDQTPPAAATVEAPVCPTGQSATDLFADDLENTASGNWTPQTGSGVNEWYYPQNSHPYAFDATYATSGDTNFWGYNRAAISDYSIRMTSDVALPASGAMYLRFDHAHGFEDDVNGAYDGGVLEYSTNGGTTWIDAGSLFTHGGYTGTIASGFGNPLAARSAFVRESNGYTSTRGDISSLAGEDIRIRFRIGTDSIFDDFGWFVDDIRIYTCAAGGDTDPPQTTITSGPSGPTDDSTPTFAFTSDEPGSTFACRVDSAAFAACTSPHTTPTLAEGPHTFEVKAKDSSDNEDPTPATRAFTVTPPPPPPPAPPVPSVSIGDAKKKEPDKGKKAMTFKVSLSAAATTPVTVAFATKNGTAKAPKDFVAGNGTLTFPAGTTTQVLKVLIKGDTRVEKNEKFTVVLSAPSGATIADGTAIGKIKDND